jgi:hypothetical protein
MKLNIYKILLACLTSFSTAAVSGGVYAQDANYPTIEEIREDAAFSTWGETDPKTGPGKVAKDSAVVNTKAAAQRQIKVADAKPAKADESVSKSKEEEDDSVLSFNFLYYIFQKYKLQDIVD